MKVVAIIKLLIAIGIFVLLFKMEAWAAAPGRVPITLMSSLTVGKQAEHEFIKPGDRIVGGRLAVHGEFPYQVSIQRISILGTRTHYCGGALVGQCVVTAAHCLEGRNPRDLSVRIGSTTLKSDQSAQDIRVNKIILHPAYDPKIIINDIGILKLSKRVKPAGGVKEVPVPDFEAEVEPDTQCIVSGWGSQHEGGTVTKELMYATIPTMSDKKCKEFYGKAEIFESMLCAGYLEGGVDSCQGDSGGPLVCDGKFVGIVSWGIGCARPRFPGVYTQVAYYTKWISSMDCFKEFNETETSLSSQSSHPAKFFNFPFFSFWKEEKQR